MKRRLLFLAAPALLAASTFAQSPATAQPELPPPPVPIYPGPPPAPPAPPVAENQQVYAPTRTSLVDPATAQALLARYRAAFPNTRIAIYVNRQLVDTGSGLQLTGRSETTSQTTTVNGAAPAPGQTQVTTSVSGVPGSDSKATLTTVTTVNGTNQYTVVNGTEAPLPDRQTVRDVERLFGRVFRNGGSLLVDSKAAAELAVNSSDQATRDRALAQVADIAVEVLISTKTIVMPSIAGNDAVTAPDIQATAIRLKDSAILGQASATDVIGRNPQLARRFGPPDIIEATALALVEDMLTGK